MPCRLKLMNQVILSPQHLLEISRAWQSQYGAQSLSTDAKAQLLLTTQTTPVLTGKGLLTLAHIANCS